MRVLDQLGFTCSAGIAHSKILAKLGSGLHKPAQQTVMPAAAVEALLRPLPLPKLRQLGGKFGEVGVVKVWLPQRVSCFYCSLLKVLW
jgi:nucleotidyltransferase/DNA polymerase involved in DNA repair